MSNAAYELVPESAEQIAVCRPLLPTLEKIAPYLISIDAHRRYTNHGDLVLELQRRIRATFDLPSHVVAASCGTSAIAGAILGSTGRATQRRPICLLPAYTFIGTVSAVELCGFTPYFVDVDAKTWKLDPARCLSHPMLDNVGLVVPVAPYGRPVGQEGWKYFSDRTGIPVVVDGAAAFAGLVADPDSTLEIFRLRSVFTPRRHSLRVKAAQYFATTKKYRWRLSNASILATGRGSRGPGRH